ncbi:MAG: hypothetical protein EHM45_06465 [Desulfobacteraceae bacterium]|nr:MAG: hypothetical protein EHM45_06465 [Desulfobacteraceae bacterium]
MNKIIKIKTDEENGMEYRIFINDRGYAVGIYDIDASETVTIINCKDESKAVEKFNEATKLIA